MGPSLALKLVGECGKDLRAWPSAKHFTAWLCLAPGNKISGGKVLSSRPLRSSNQAAVLLRLQHHRRAARYFARCILPPAVLTCGQVEGADGDRLQDCSSILQHPPARHELQRSRCQPLLQTISQPRPCQPSEAGQLARLRIAGHSRTRKSGCLLGSRSRSLLGGPK
ncbi:transposase [Bradyrhizobium lupini]|uniref:transposase n=1 Tax=Rhizobium lupini TaxID=136996 RepID=UPI0034C67D6E